MKTICKLRFELLRHSYYNLNLTCRDYWLIASLKRLLQAKKFSSNEEVIAEVEVFLKSEDKSFYNKGLEKLEEHWTEYIS